MTSTEAAAVHAGRAPEATRSGTLTWQDPLSVAAAGAELKGIETVAAVRRPRRRS